MAVSGSAADNAAGKVTQMTDASGTIKYRYGKLGEVTEERVRILQEADDIFVRALRAYRCPDGRSLYEITWQAGAVLLADIRTVGVMGDERTYDYPVVLRAVTSCDAMTADWADLPSAFLRHVSNEIINKVKGVNRVCYDISSKPPATIEWE